MQSLFDSYLKQFLLILMFGMRRRSFLIEQFLHALLVARAFTTQYIPVQIFLVLIVAILIAQYFREGYTPKFLFLLPLLTLQIFGELNNNLQAQYIAAILGGVLHFIPLKMYWLPEPKKTVGFREDTLENNLHYIEFYPLDQEKQIQFRSIKWCYTKQIGKMIQHKKISNHLMKKIGHMILSYADKHSLKIGVGTEKKTDRGIAFCHGRGATPFFYSSLLLHFAGEDYRVGGVQHTEVVDTKEKTKEAMKIFRERQVQVRAAEYYQAIQRLGTEKIILMGHSYGCATVIQAYHSLEQKLKQKVTHIILLDPWFFPLNETTFGKSISCPTLVLANEDFIRNPDMYIRNKKFLDLHKGDKVEYILWKNAHHLHQTDLGFVNGNLLQACKHSHLSQLFLDLNLQAITKFIKGEVVEGTYGPKDLGRSFSPQKFYSEDNFMY